LSSDLICVGGISIPYMQNKDIKTVRFNAVIEGGRLILYIDSLMHVSRSVAIDDISRVTLFAEGGTATFEKATVWELK